MSSTAQPGKKKRLYCVKIYLNQDTCYIYIFVPHYLYTVKSPFGFRKHYLYTVKSPQRPPLSVDALVA